MREVSITVMGIAYKVFVSVKWTDRERQTFIKGFTEGVIRGNQENNQK